MAETKTTDITGATITLIAPGGIRTALQQLLPVFEQNTGCKVTPTFTSGGATKARTAEGEMFDVPVIQPPLDSVIASGHVVAASETPIATVSVVMVVAAGIPKPDISTAAGVKKLLLETQSIAYPSAARGAACGVSFEATMKKLGVFEAMASKIKDSPTGWESVAMAARGEVAVGVTFASEMDPDDRVQLLGAMPRELSTPTGFVAFVNAQSKAPAAASALIQFLTSPEARAVFTKAGMTPGK
jgi:molybdate transport system substrate-binding protein